MEWRDRGWWTHRIHRKPHVFTGCPATRGAASNASGKAGDATPGRLAIMERGPVDAVALSRRRECTCGLTALPAVAIGTPLASAGAEALTLRVAPWLSVSVSIVPTASVADAAVLSGLPRTSSSGNCGGSTSSALRLRRVTCRSTNVLRPRPFARGFTLHRTPSTSSTTPARHGVVAVRGLESPRRAGTVLSAQYHTSVATSVCPVGTLATSVRRTNSWRSCWRPLHQQQQRWQQE